MFGLNSNRGTEKCLTPREAVADAYRQANNAFRPFAEGDLDLWATLEPSGMLALAQIATSAELSWRRTTTYTGCIWGPRGEPPYALVNCEACAHA